MSNLKLVPDAPTPLEKLLLDASRAEQPSSEHKARLRAALGLGLPLSGPLTTTQPSPVAQPALPTASKSFTAAKVGASAAALALVGVLILSRGASAPSAPLTSVAPSPVVVAPLPPEPKVVVAEERAASPLPPVEPPAAVVTPKRAAAPVATADLSEQIRLIEAARAGVAGRDAQSALAALDSYATKFPRGAFGQEATVLRIRALDQSGDSARASALARSFVARFPNSPHVARLKPIAERGASR